MYTTSLETTTDYTMALSTCRFTTLKQARLEWNCIIRLFVFVHIQVATGVRFLHLSCLSALSAKSATEITIIAASTTGTNVAT